MCVCVLERKRQRDRVCVLLMFSYPQITLIFRYLFVYLLPCSFYSLFGDFLWACFSLSCIVWLKVYLRHLFFFPQQRKLKDNRTVSGVKEVIRDLRQILSSNESSSLDETILYMYSNQLEWMEKLSTIKENPCEEEVASELVFFLLVPFSLINLNLSLNTLWIIKYKEKF